MLPQYHWATKYVRGNAAHLRQSSFYKKLMRKEILHEHHITIGGQQILIYVVGDSTYYILTQI